MARVLAVGEKPLAWVGTSRKDLMAFPDPVKDEIGNALGVAQFGGRHPSAKPWKGLAGGVLEVVEDFDGDTYRCVYCVRFRRQIYVLHAFQKKSPSGRRTARNDVALIEQRLKIARADYEARYGTEDK